MTDGAGDRTNSLARAAWFRLSGRAGRRTSTETARLRVFAGCALIFLVITCFAGVLFQDRQFAFRDAGHHYYPLHQRIQQEWTAGRIPLWDPWENGGQPFLGNPTAAVFYPGKLLFALLPLPWAARAYVIVHVAWAFLGMCALLRAWGRSPTARAIGSIAYAFGGPVLFLYNNVIYLVGAAWLPWGLWAMSGWLRRGTPNALAAFALTLALPVLGGDPQTSYLLVIVAIVLLAFRVTRDRPTRPGLHVQQTGRRLLPPQPRWPIVIVCALIASYVLVWVLPAYRAFWERWPWGNAAERVMRSMLVTGALIAWLMRRRPERSAIVRRMLKLSAACLVAWAVAGVQVVPTAEFMAGSTRAEAGAGLDRYGFSLVPYRILEFLWPGALGSPYPENASWRSVLPPRDDPTFWVPSLYLGTMPLTLALIAIGGAGRDRTRRPLIVLAIVALLASFGLYAAPLGWTRWLPPVGSFLPLPDVPHLSSAHDDFRAGDGGPYWLLAALLPGFEFFRFPSKLLHWAALAIAALAAIGWDDCRRMPLRKHALIPMNLILISGFFFLALSIILWMKTPDWLLQPGVARASVTSGPFQAGSAVAQSTRALGHALAALLCSAMLLLPRVRMPRAAGPLALGLVALDLAVAQSPWMWTVPQTLFDAPSRAILAIEAEEAREPSTGPYRIHRPAVWHPYGWFAETSPRRLERIVAFERDSLQPLYGLPLNQQYTFTLGILEPETHLRLFRPWLVPAGAALAPVLGVPPDRPILYFPRRAFDLWNTRYFILPVDGLNWRDENRAYASFLDQTKLILPNLEQLDRQNARESWRRDQDWQVFRNKSAFPRAWVVHAARVMEPIDRLDGRARTRELRRFLYQADTLWRETSRDVVDLRRTAWVETDNPRELRLRLEEPADPLQEVVLIRHYDPQRVEIKTRLAGRGLVVLADAHAPGWTLTIDGRPADILRVNLGMRGAVVEPGDHVLIYRYEPRAFRLGAALTIAGMIAVAGMLLADAARQARHTQPRR